MLSSSGGPLVLAGCNDHLARNSRDSIEPPTPPRGDRGGSDTDDDSIEDDPGLPEWRGWVATCAHQGGTVCRDSQQVIGHGQAGPTPAHTPLSAALSNRVTDELSFQPSQSQAGPLSGISDAETMSLWDAVKADTELAAVPNINGVVVNAQRATANVALVNGMTRDEAAALHAYTQESGLYRAVGNRLRDPERAKAKPLFPYLKLLFGALRKLPRLEKQTVFRGVKRDLTEQYPKDKQLVWWSVSSCTRDVSVLNNPMFLGTSGDRTMFDVTAWSLTSIAEYSAVPSEAEVLLWPGTLLKVTEVRKLEGGLTMVHLEQQASGPALVDYLGSPQPRPTRGSFYIATVNQDNYVYVFRWSVHTGEWPSAADFLFANERSTKGDRSRALRRDPFERFSTLEQAQEWKNSNPTEPAYPGDSDILKKCRRNSRARVHQLYVVSHGERAGVYSKFEDALSGCRNFDECENCSSYPRREAAKALKFMLKRAIETDTLGVRKGIRDPLTPPRLHVDDGALCMPITLYLVAAALPVNRRLPPNYYNDTQGTREKVHGTCHSRTTRFLREQGDPREHVADKHLNDSQEFHCYWGSKLVRRLTAREKSRQPKATALTVEGYHGRVLHHDALKLSNFKAASYGARKAYSNETHRLKSLQAAERAASDSDAPSPAACGQSDDAGATKGPAVAVQRIPTSVSDAEASEAPPVFLGLPKPDRERQETPMKIQYHGGDVDGAAVESLAHALTELAEADLAALKKLRARPSGFRPNAAFATLPRPTTIICDNTYVVHSLPIVLQHPDANEHWSEQMWAHEADWYCVHREYTKRLRYWSAFRNELVRKHKIQKPIPDGRVILGYLQYPPQFAPKLPTGDTEKQWEVFPPWLIPEQYWGHDDEFWEWTSRSVCDCRLPTAEGCVESHQHHLGQVVDRMYGVHIQTMDNPKQVPAQGSRGVQCDSLQPAPRRHRTE